MLHLLPIKLLLYYIWMVCHVLWNFSMKGSRAAHVLVLMLMKCAKTWSPLSLMNSHTLTNRKEIFLTYSFTAWLKEICFSRAEESWTRGVFILLYKYLTDGLKIDIIYPCMTYLPTFGSIGMGAFWLNGSAIVRIQYLQLLIIQIRVLLLQFQYKVTANYPISRSWWYVATAKLVYMMVCCM